MKLIPVPPQFIDKAWFKQGASCLSEACETSGGEITGDQLKMMLSRGERTLLRMDDDEEKTVGWGVVMVDQRPNFRILHVCEMTAHNGHFESYFKNLKEIAEAYGCSRIRLSCGRAQARLYRMKLGAKPVYETLEVIL